MDGPQGRSGWPDKVVTADGQPMRVMADLHAITHRVSVGAPIVYTVEQDGQHREGRSHHAVNWDDLVMTFGVTFPRRGYLRAHRFDGLPDEAPTRRSAGRFSLRASPELFAITSFDIIDARGIHLAFTSS